MTCYIYVAIYFRRSNIINVADKNEDREYTALATDGGIVLCDKVEGAFLVIRSENDLQRLKQLLDKIQIIK